MIEHAQPRPRDDRAVGERPPQLELPQQVEDAVEDAGVGVGGEDERAAGEAAEREPLGAEAVRGDVTKLPQAGERAAGADDQGRRLTLDTVAELDGAILAEQPARPRASSSRAAASFAEGAGKATFANAVRRASRRAPSSTAS